MQRDAVSTSCNAQPRRAAARLKADGAGRTCISSAAQATRDRGADAEAEGIAGGQHADALPAQRRQARRASASKGSARRGLARDDVSHERQVPLAAEDDCAPQRRRAWPRRADRRHHPRRCRRWSAIFRLKRLRLCPSEDMATPHILILGGTAEARLLAARLGSPAATASRCRWPGAQKRPFAQPAPSAPAASAAPTAWCAYLREREVDLLIDATHPYAARISANAAASAASQGRADRACGALRWQRVEGDRWNAGRQHGGCRRSP